MGRLGMVVSTRVVWSGSVIIVLEVDVRTFLEHDSDKFAVSFPGREMHGEFHLHLEQ
jgi:hypothetical protein